MDKLITVPISQEILIDGKFQNVNKSWKLLNVHIVVITISNASNCKIIIKSCQNSITIINGILTYHFGYYSNIFNIKYNEKKENLKILIQYPDELFIPDFSIKIESNEKHHIIINTYFVEKFSLETIEYLYDHNKALQTVISI